jgi:hypothetical protein
MSGVSVKTPQVKRRGGKERKWKAERNSVATREKIPRRRQARRDASRQL